MNFVEVMQRRASCRCIFYDLTPRDVSVILESQRAKGKASPTPACVGGLEERRVWPVKEDATTTRRTATVRAEGAACYG